jgi:hypothetical protein
VRLPRMTTRRWMAAVVPIAGLLAIPLGNRPRALVVVNDEEIGPAPVSGSFTYYGEHKSKLMRDGSMTRTVVKPTTARSIERPGSHLDAGSRPGSTHSKRNPP